MLLYTIGDSFTYGQELPTPKKQCWPKLLANSLKFNLINGARGGIGNEFIVKKTMQAITKIHPDLVIVAWTSAGRTELADEWGVYDIWPGCNSEQFNEDTSGKLLYRKKSIKYITRYNNEEHEYRRWLRQVILLQSFLKQHKIRYLFVNAFDNQQRNQKYKNTNQGYWELIDTTKFAGWPSEGFVEWVYATPHGPYGHPLEEGHKIIADKLLLLQAKDAWGSQTVYLE